jgi:hypothetical protein
MGKFGWGIVLIIISIFSFYTFISDSHSYKKGLENCQNFNENSPDTLWAPDGDIIQPNGTIIHTLKEVPSLKMDCSIWEFPNTISNGALEIGIPTGIIGIMLLIFHFKKKSKLKIKKIN